MDSFNQTRQPKALDGHPSTTTNKQTPQDVDRREQADCFLISFSKKNNADNGWSFFFTPLYATAGFTIKIVAIDDWAPTPQLHGSVSRCCCLLLHLVKPFTGLLNPKVCLPSPRFMIETKILHKTFRDNWGNTSQDTRGKQRYLMAVMAPRVQSIEKVLPAPDLKNTENKQRSVTLAYTIAAIAFLSKGSVKPSFSTSVGSLSQDNRYFACSC